MIWTRRCDGVAPCNGSSGEGLYSYPRGNGCAPRLSGLPRTLPALLNSQTHVLLRWFLWTMGFTRRRPERSAVMFSFVAHGERVTRQAPAKYHAMPRFRRGDTRSAPVVARVYMRKYQKRPFSHSAPPPCVWQTTERHAPRCAAVASEDAGCPRWPVWARGDGAVG